MTYDSYEIKKLRKTARVRDARMEAPCYLCGDPIDYGLAFPHPACWSLDHAVAQSAGGMHVMSNAVPAHLLCNQARQDKPLVPGMFKGRRPVPGQSGVKPVVPGSRGDKTIWTNKNRPIDSHGIFPETRCSNCPCVRSQWWSGSYEDEYAQAERELDEFHRTGVRLK